MADKIALFIEKELLIGTVGKTEGISTAEAVADSVTPDNLITLQDSIKQRYQNRCRWIMNSKTKDLIRKFKDNNGQYFLVRDYSSDGTNWNILGKPVDITDTLEDGVVYYGDYSGNKVKVVETPNLQILRETFAIEHAVGVVAWLEMDAKLVEPYKVKCIKPE